MKIKKTRLDIRDLTAGRNVSALALEATRLLVMKLLERSRPGRRYLLEITGDSGGRYVGSGTIQVTDGYSADDVGLIMNPRNVGTSYIGKLTAKNGRRSALFSDITGELGSTVFTAPEEPEGQKAVGKPGRPRKELAQDERIARRIILDIMDKVAIKWWTVQDVFDIIFEHYKVIGARQARRILERMVAAGFLKKDGTGRYADYAVTPKGKRLANG